MCGIAGFYGLEDKDMLRCMCDAISHRGPDDHGYFFDKDICLGNRRLSIIDLPGGKQPMTNEDGTIVVVFNGEIYNFGKIRKDLESKGHRFSTNSDTEVLVHGYEEYGHSLLERLNGMFAFAIWDSEKKELFIARDRIGIKPLYYHWDGNVLLFSSEIKSVLASGMVKPDISDKALMRYLVLRYVPGDITMIEGIRKLMPGHFLTAGKGGLGVRKYWDVEFGDEMRSLDECKSSIASLLEESVKMRLISDVPIGAFLSGGIDSSIIVGLMSQLTDKVKTFSIGFDDERYNELDHARVVSEHFGTDHQEKVIDSEMFIKALPKVAWHLDEPIGDPAAIATYFVSELARKKVKVVLTGEGGDELFAGYPKYSFRKREILADYYSRSPKVVRKAMGRMPGKYGISANSVAEAGRFYLAPAMKRAKLLEKSSGSGISSDIKSVFSPYMGNNDRMSEMQYVDMKTWLPEDLLMKVDKMTMANSIEARVPFLDHRMLSLAMRIPSKLRIRSGTEKYVLRESFSEMLPASTLERKKQGFSLPMKEWGSYLDFSSNDDEFSSIMKEIDKKYLERERFRTAILKTWFDNIREKYVV